MAVKKVGDIEHPKSGISVPFYLDGTKFTCTCLERIFSAPDANTLRAQVLDHIEHWMVLDWHPVIFVEYADSDGWGGSKKTGLWIDFKRVFLSRSPAGKVLSCPWEVEEAHRKAVCGPVLNAKELTLASLPLGAPLMASRGQVWIDYSEDRWRSLERIKEGIGKLSEMISTLISTSKGNAVLEQSNVMLRLLSGNVENQTHENAIIQIPNDGQPQGADS